MTNNTINYSQCWEDPGLLLHALNITNKDSVLSITSGGDNTLAILLLNPKKVTSVDLNPNQNYLLELKLSAAKSLNYNEYLEFLGVNHSSNRFKYYDKVKTYLSNPANLWWLNQKPFINKGVINTGRFETFLNFFQKFILPFIHSKSTINKFITISSIEDQRDFYYRNWNTKLWNLYFRFSSSRFVLNNFARQKGMFKHANLQNTAKQYIGRLEKNFTTVPLFSNYFMHYCLTGKYTTSLPPYLYENNFKALKSISLLNLSYVNKDLLSYLKTVPDNTFSKFNLSDIFEALSETETEDLWQEIIRTGKKEATVVYWENLLSRPVPKKYSHIAKFNKILSDQLFDKDRVFFYGGFSIYTIFK